MHFKNVFNFLILYCSTSLGECFNFNEAVFVLNSQPYKHHKEVAAKTKQTLQQSLINKNFSETPVLDISQDLKIRGAWTLFSLLPFLFESFKGKVKWFVFLDEDSEVNLDVLGQVLEPFKTDYGIFLGYAIARKGVFHPDIKAGFVMSAALIADILALEGPYYR